MSSNPYQPPASDLHTGAEIISAVSTRWLLQTFVLTAAIFGLLGLSLVAIIEPAFGKTNAAPLLRLLFPFSFIPFLFLFLAPWAVRQQEKKMQFLSARPGGAPSGHAIALKMGLASRGFPLNSGALVLTPSELVFYRRRFRRWAEEMRIPLNQIATLETRKSLLHPKLCLEFRNGARITFRALYASRWKDAILEVLEEA